MKCINPKTYKVTDELIEMLNNSKIPWRARFHEAFCFYEKGKYFDDTGELKNGIFWKMKKGVTAEGLEAFIEKIKFESNNLTLKGIN